jgi:hypothetical protein
VLLFIGVFSTPTPPPETSERSDSPKPRKRSGTRSANGGTKLGHAARSGRVELDRNFLDLTPNGRGDWYAKLDYVSHFRKSISREEKSPDAQAYSQMQCSLDGYVSGPAGELDWIFPDFDAEYADWGRATSSFRTGSPTP